MDDAVVDLLGVLAYAELSAFMRMASDGEYAPDMFERTYLSKLAVTEFHHYEELAARLENAGVDTQKAMQPFVAPVEDFHARTQPTNWLESLVKAYVGDGFAKDFYREIAHNVDDDTRIFVDRVLDSSKQREFIIAAVADGLDVEPHMRGRLSLWARRLVGEALSQAQRVAADRPGLTSLLMGQDHAKGADLAQLATLFSHLMKRHNERMEELGFA